jgi:hypothetical protein
MGEWLIRVMRSLGWMPVPEAVQVDSFETQLQALETSAEQREEYRQMVLTAAKAGLVSADEFARVLSQGMSLMAVRMSDLDWARGRSDEEIDRRRSEIWDES